MRGKIVITTIIMLVWLLPLVSTVSAGQSVKMVYWRYTEPSSTEGVQKLCDDYQKEHPNVQIEIQTFPWAQYMSEKLMVGFATGRGPDIFEISQANFMTMVKSGIAYDLTPYVPDEVWDDFYPNVLDCWTVRDKLYVMPREVEPRAFFYNKKVFEETGATPPKHWDDLVATAQKLQTPTRYGFLIPSLAPDGFTSTFFYIFLWQAGGDLVDKEGNVVFDEPPAIRALQWWGDLLNQYKIIPPDITPDMFAQEQAAMVLHGQWMLNYWKEQYPEFEYVTIQIPYPRDGNPASLWGAWSPMVNSRSEYADEAAKLLAWMCADPDPARCIWYNSEVNYCQPPRISAAKAPFYQTPEMKVWADEIMPVARTEPTLETELVNYVIDAYSDVMFGGLSPEEAAKRCAKEMRDFLAGG